MIVSSLDIFQMAGRRSTSQTKSRRTIAVKWTIILAAPFLGKEYETLRKPYQCSSKLEELRPEPTPRSLF